MHGFSSIFWNTEWTHGQPPHALGILCDPQHPALSGFPTSYHSDWQWWDLNAHACPLVLDQLPADLQPIIQVVDDWNSNRRLGLVIEVRVGDGRLLVCSIDLTNNLEVRPVARRLRYSLEKYVKGPAFNPAGQIDSETAALLFGK